MRSTFSEAITFISLVVVPEALLFFEIFARLAVVVHHNLDTIIFYCIARFWNSLPLVIRQSATFASSETKMYESFFDTQMMEDYVPIL